MLAKARRSTLIRLWLSQHQGGMHLAMGAVVIVVLAVIFLPRMGPTQLVGRVAGFALNEPHGRFPLAYVQLSDRRVTVHLGAHSCATGDRIHIEKHKALWGPSYRAGVMACDFGSEPSDAQAR
ncbi:hypothetical protein [Phenylobacterium sp.]|uniref:hypothetical protein n=1 Tax=Phenylobacterium sp. TaxID=1871053 RepID=UPI003BAC7158